jgi:hypothetical protein
MLPSLGPLVAAAPYLARAAAYTAAWATYGLATQALVDAHVRLLGRVGLRRSAPRRPAAPAARLAAVGWLSYAAYFLGVGALQARGVRAHSRADCGGLCFFSRRLC